MNYIGHLPVCFKFKVKSEHSFSFLPLENRRLKRRGMRSYCTAEGTISNLLGWNMIEDSMRKKCILVYDWFTALSSEIDKTL